MRLIDKIKYEWNYLGVPKEQRFDYILKKKIEDKTGFKNNKIELLIAKKLDMKKHNEFDYFEFIYMKKKYILKRNKLEEVI